MRGAGIPFEEEVIRLCRRGQAARILKYSPAGKVPILIDGDSRVGVARDPRIPGEKFPDARPLAGRSRARAHARAVSAEMHAGFSRCATSARMNMSARRCKRELSAEAQANAGRIDAMWTECRRRFGAGGPFLFGRFRAADAMYAPVVSRFGATPSA